MSSPVPSLSRWLAIEILMVLSTGVVLGLLGPFGSYALPLGWRLAYWVGFGLIGYALFRPLIVVAEWAAAVTPIPQWAAIILSAMVAGIPMTWMIGFAIGGMEYRPEILGDGFTLLYAQTTGIGLGIYLLSAAVFGRPEQANPSPPKKPETYHDAAPAGIGGSALHEHLPPGFPPIIALSVEDHYVKIHAEGRNEMLLMKLSEATAMMEPDDGLQIHRSWWAAKSAVVKAKRDGRNLQLELAGGLIAPVSRANVAAVREAGWLDR